MKKITKKSSQEEKYQMQMLPFIYNFKWVLLVFEGGVLTLNETFYTKKIRTEYLATDVIAVYGDDFIYVFDLLRDFGSQKVLSLEGLNENSSVSFKRVGKKWTYEVKGVFEFNTELPLYKRVLLNRNS